MGIAPKFIAETGEGRMRYLVVVEGLSGWVRYRALGIDCRRMGL